ncbi:hypothetical protein DU57_02580 [Methanosarcina mazei]|jgi:glycosyltransferase involved in cell wall biosynthesis|uniref:Glycosyltransferase family 1 protein n=1 Tax=Methanosarcina mazei TaxID=2209 RepID=A0A0F8JGH0_METMZ|nr:glycosyltransferase family 4 protein [Methanosarcina mazei]KKG86211.1 hypothetical protein DU57_02580 [Methanosarcina mazei]KKG90709.1 hypothetical protein DU59_06500 [Methanosarcina mazei]KKH05822.1 hypothetical protein DU42_07355 [Methanosarcina mazei]
MIKVLMLGNFPLNNSVGGVSVHTANLVKSIGKIDDDEFEFWFVSFGNRSMSFNCGNVRIRIVKAYKLYYILPFIAILKLHFVTNEIKPQILHVQGSNISPYLLFALLKQNIRKIITVHGLMSIETKFKSVSKVKLLNFLSIIIERYALKSIPNIIVCSKDMKQLVSNISSSRIHVIPNGINFEYIQRYQKHLSIKKPALLYMGLLSRIKGVDVLLNAMPIIVKEEPDVHLYIAGSGSEYENLVKIVEDLNLVNHVTFLGFVSGIEKYSFYNSIDICILPSIYESFGIVSLEAMACGKPVIASNTGGIPDVVEDGKTGLLFEPSNFGDLAKKIITLLGDETLREKMGEEGFKRAKLFQWDHVANSTKHLYEDLYRGVYSMNEI